MVMHDFSIDAVQRCARLLRCTRAMTASLLVTAVSLGGTTTATGQTTATWLSPVSGSWTDASKWSTSPTYPRNGQPTAADIYDVVIDATGSAYTVSTETLGFDFTLNSLTLNSPDATVYFENYGLSAANGIDLQAGLLELSDFIANTTITGNDNALIKGRGGTLDNVILSGVPVVIGGAIEIRNGLTLNSTVRLDNTANTPGSQQIFNFFDDQTLSGTGEVVFDGVPITSSTGTDSAMRAWEGTLTIGPDIVIRTGTSGGYIQGIDGSNAGFIINQGTIIAQTPDKPLTLSRLANQGTIQVTDGTLRIAKMSIGDLGTIDRTGGTVQIIGDFDITGQVYDLAATTGTTQLALDGTIVGGVIRGDANTRLEVVYTLGNTDTELHGVTLAADVHLEHKADLIIRDGLTLLSGNTISLYREDDGTSSHTSVSSKGGSQTLDGGGTIVFKGSNPQNAVYAYDGTLTIGPGIIIETDGGSGRVGYGSAFGGNNQAIVNQGTISAQSPGQTITVGYPDNYGAHVNNTGVLEAKNGGTIDLFGKWHNTGTLRIDDGTILLGGSFTTADLGTIDRTGGILRVTGTMDNTGSTIALDAVTGSLEIVEGATIVNGSLTTSDGVELIAHEGDVTLSGVVFDANLRIRGGARLTTPDGDPLSANRTITLEAISGESSPYLYVPSDITIDGPGHIRAEGSTRTANLEQITGSLTIAPDVTVTTDSASLAIGKSNGTLTFEGTAIAEGNGIIRLRGSSVYNQGDVVATNGGLVRFEGLSGDIGNAAVTGLNSHLDVRGTYNNEQDRLISDGSILSLFGTWTNSASITVDNATLRLGGSSSAIGDFDVADSAIVIRDGTYSTAQIESIPYVNTTVTIETRGILDNTGDTLDLNTATGSWRLSDGRIDGGSVAATGGAQLVILGGSNVLDDVALDTDITVESGASLTLSGNWSHVGTLLSDGGLVTFGGTFETNDLNGFVRTGGSVRLTGVLDNTGANLDLASYGPFSSRGGTIQNGTITGTEGMGLIISPGGTTTLDAVTVDAPLAIEGWTSVLNGLTLAGNSVPIGATTEFTTARLTFSGPQLLDGNAEIIVNGTTSPTYIIASAGALTIGPNITIRSGTQGGIISGNGGIINQGTIRAQATGLTTTIETAMLENMGLLEATAGGTLSIVTDTWTNDGQMHLDGGTFEIDGSSFTNSATGVIDGTGTLDVSGTTFTNNGFISPGLSPGVLNVIGDLLMGPTSQLNLEIGGTNPGVDYDQLLISGDVTLDGLLSIDFINGFTPGPNDQFNLLAGAAIDGAFDSIIVTGINSEVSFATVDGSFALLVPEPSTLALLAFGALACNRRQRCR